LKALRTHILTMQAAPIWSHRRLDSRSMAFHWQDHSSAPIRLAKVVSPGRVVGRLPDLLLVLERRQRQVLLLVVSKWSHQMPC